MLCIWMTLIRLWNILNRLRTPNKNFKYRDSPVFVSWPAIHKKSIMSVASNCNGDNKTGFQRKNVYAELLKPLV